MGGQWSRKILPGSINEANTKGEICKSCKHNLFSLCVKYPVMENPLQRQIVQRRHRLFRKSHATGAHNMRFHWLIPMVEAEGVRLHVSILCNDLRPLCGAQEIPQPQSWRKEWGWDLAIVIESLPFQIEIVIQQCQKTCRMCVGGTSTCHVNARTWTHQVCFNEEHYVFR